MDDVPVTTGVAQSVARRLAVAYKTGPSSIFGLAPQVGFSHSAYKKGGDG